MIKSERTPLGCFHRYGLVLTLLAAPLHYAFAQTPIGEFDIQFTFVASTKNTVSSSSQPKQKKEPKRLEEGQTVSATDILAMTRAKGSSTQDESLFEDARLSVSLQSRDGSLVVWEEIASCARLDIYSSPEETFQEKARCDGSIYGINVTRRGVAVTLNDTLFRVFALSAGTYLLNGVPFQVDKN